MTLAPPSEVVTPLARTVVRRSLFWVGVVVVLGLVTTVLVTSVSSLGSRVDLGASNPAPGGAQAVARVLAQNGVHVIESDDLDTTLAASSSDSTVLLYDAGDLLDADRLARLAALPGDLVLVQPSATELDALAPDVLPAGGVSGELAADCALPAAQRADTITADGFGYRMRDGAEAVTCFDSGDGIRSLVVETRGGRSVTVLGSASVLANETVATDGDAALALGLLGTRSELVWYLPGVADLTASGAPPSLADLIPTWFAPLASLALLVTLLAALWRGRRLGPLVVERLPVIVRASETMEGRARLYAKNSTRLHALDAIRIGTIARLASLCGLPRTASVDDVVIAVSGVLGRDATGIRAVLVDAQPLSDRDLVRMSDDLTRLEGAVRDVLRPDSPTGRMRP